MSRIPVYAHRGASAYVLENSYTAFVKAKEMGADGLEIDLQLTKDGVPIVTHDIDFWRLAGNPKRIPDLLYEEARKIKLGKRRFWRKFNGEHVMTFEEVLEFAILNGLKLNVELKESFLTAPESAYLLFSRSYEGIDIHFSSFHYEILEKIKKVNPSLETAFIGTKKLNWRQLSFLAATDAIHVHKRYYKKENLDLAEQSRKKVRFYGIDGKESFIVNPHPVVAGWITDFPDVVLKKQKGIPLS
ncbi:MAG: glycerophosphodiester phosphodiesterase family protein [Paenisporosarcina sp.]